ncbi:YihY/virulence factor BrkB family protein [Spongiactinospora sp. TRM90649]|uniref:YihY/virulence factor BrkB family protein n=1 Tax=Spongiactinospora sp. TRM90649 TaxID=3031114 RepID=UPI0023FA1F91|nr:YihY/virulence factor BrkB family protein [Spongiactinospora sp. TRM90649]MDF5757876.1 YihY/virulence factor BrkB family protein [Spongiactinospora sp. TRM90649]
MTSTDAPSQGANNARAKAERKVLATLRRVRRLPRAVAVRARAGLGRVRDSGAWALVRATTLAGVAYRVTGLAGEAAFFALLSLPPFVLGLIGVLAHLSTFLGPEVIRDVRDRIEEQAHVLFTDNAVDRVVTPLLDDVLAGGQVPLISLGFLLSLWSGSRALFVYVDLISVAYGLGEERGIIRTRIMSFGLYIVALLIAIIVMPVLVVGPTLVVGAIPAPYAVVVDVLYWPVLIVGSVLFLTVLYHVSVPVRTRWWREVPGALLALVIWILCAAVLRAVLAAWFTPLSVYGSLAAPIAVLLWLYITALAVLIGATLNAEVDRLWPAAGAGRAARGGS